MAEKGLKLVIETYKANVLGSDLINNIDNNR